jgi:hypothetical protein
MWELRVAHSRNSQRARCASGSAFPCPTTVGCRISLELRSPTTISSLLKRGIIGNYHKVSAKYLALYLNEFSCRFNNRKNPDIFDAIIAGC